MWLCLFPFTAKNTWISNTYLSVSASPSTAVRHPSPRVLYLFFETDLERLCVICCKMIYILKNNLINSFRPSQVHQSVKNAPLVILNVKIGSTHIFLILFFLFLLSTMFRNINIIICSGSIVKTGTRSASTVWTSIFDTSGSTQWPLWEKPVPLYYIDVSDQLIAPTIVLQVQSWCFKKKKCHVPAGKLSPLSWLFCPQFSSNTDCRPI
jgi:hypothetical protein